MDGRTRFAIDGVPGPRSDTIYRVEDTLSVGKWIGVSGAAFSRGLGRQTTIASSILMALGDVRLGRWWRSGIRPDRPSHGRSAYYFRKLFQTQAYLVDEMFGQFYGTRRRMHYLSDCGHFENTVTYALLHQQRGVKLIVMCDCGCDPDYQFEDLANLIRLARIDFSGEIEVDETIARTGGVLAGVFGTPDDFDPKRTKPRVEKCAMLLNVFFRQSNKTQTPDIRNVMLNRT